MGNESFLTYQDDVEVKETSFTKKLAAPLAVAAICGVAALLVAGGKSTTVPDSTEMIALGLAR